MVEEEEDRERRTESRQRQFFILEIECMAQSATDCPFQDLCPFPTYKKYA